LKAEIDPKIIEKVTHMVQNATYSTSAFVPILLYLQNLLGKEYAKFCKDRKRSVDSKKKSTTPLKKKIIPLNFSSPIGEEPGIPEISLVLNDTELYNMFYDWLPGAIDRTLLGLYKGISELFSLTSGSLPFTSKAKWLSELVREVGLPMGEETEEDSLQIFSSALEEICEKLSPEWILFQLHLNRQSTEILLDFCSAVQAYKKYPTENLAKAIGFQFLGMSPGSRSIPVQEGLVGDAIRRIRSGHIKKDLFKKIVEEKSRPSIGGNLRE